MPDPALESGVPIVIEAATLQEADVVGHTAPQIPSPGGGFGIGFGHPPSTSNRHHPQAPHQPHPSHQPPRPTINKIQNTLCAGVVPLPLYLVFGFERGFHACYHKTSAIGIQHTIARL
jgi:hypothetical protein